MIYPILNVNITGGYTNSHQALDLGWTNTKNEELLACDDGVVENIYYINDGGNTLLINYQNGYKSYFMHCSKILVSIGNIVSKKQVVALMGATGTECTGPHCHFILKLNGNRVNPLEHCYIESWQSVSKNTLNYAIMYKKEEILEPQPVIEPPAVINISEEPKIDNKENNNNLEISNNQKKKKKCSIIKKIIESFYLFIKYLIKK